MKIVQRSKKEGKQPLYTRLYIDGKVKWVCLRIKVDVTEWNEASQTDRKLKNFLVNKGISKKIALIDEAIADMRKHHRFTMENLEECIENIVFAEKRLELKHTEQLKKEIVEKKKRDIKNFIVEHIEKLKSGEARTISSKEKMAKGSLKSWGQFKRVFLDFYDLQPFTWEEINDAIVDRFVAYLEMKGYMKTTIVKRVCQLKTIVGIAERQGLHSNHNAYEMIKRRNVEEQDKSKKIYLSKEELSALYEMPLNGFEEQVRDVFLIGCYTAMRFSDYSRINKSSIGTTAKGTKVIRMAQKKTNKIVVIPILDERLEALLKKYDYNVPTICDQNLNRTIKEVCKKLSAMVPSLAKYERTQLTLNERKAEADALKKGEKMFEYDEQGFAIKHRYDLVSSHTARRSCITNMYLSKKFTTMQMMSISGHKTEAMFNNYVKLSLDEFADNVALAACDGLF